MERSVLNIILKDKQRNTVIREKTQVILVDASQHAQALKWAGYLARSEDDKCTLRTIWKGLNEKRRRRRPTERWQDEIEKSLNHGWQKQKTSKHGNNGRRPIHVEGSLINCFKVLSKNEELRKNSSSQLNNNKGFFILLLVSIATSNNYSKLLVD